MSEVKLDENPYCSEPRQEGLVCGSASTRPLLVTRVNRIFFFSSTERAQRLFASGSVTGSGDSLPFLEWSGRARQAGKITDYGPRRRAAVAFLSQSDRIFRVLCKTRAASRSFRCPDAPRFSASADHCMTEMKLRCPVAASEG
jgi:hypothetical protein